MKLWCGLRGPAPAGWDWATTLQEAESVLMSGKVHLASVSYRLKDGTAVDLLEWMELHPGFRPSHWIEVHETHRDVANRLKKCVKHLYGRKR